MKQHPRLIPHIADLIAHAGGLSYQDHHANAVMVRIQPLAMIEKINADPATARKLGEGGVVDALVIGNDEFGVPILLSCESLKTYLFDAEDEPGSYLKHEIVIRHT